MAETIAIIRALELASDYSLRAINICTDSLSILLALMSGKNKKHKLCPLIEDIRTKIYNLISLDPYFSYKFIWCPSHVDISGNERADEEAKTAAESSVLVNNKVDYNQLVSYQEHIAR